MDVKNTTSKEEVAALEQWAREAKKWEMVRTDEWPDTILSLCGTVRAQQKMHDADLTRDHAAILHWQARAERDAALQEAAAAQAAWASDVAEWKEWLLGAEQARDGWQQLAEQAEAALTEARRVLREVQWDRSGECPMCGGLRDGDTHVYHASHVEVVRGHFPACALDAVLAQESR